MPTLTYDWIVAAIFIGLFSGSFFHGFRGYAISVCVIAWQLFTPIRPWYIDLPLMLMCFFLTEYIFTAIKTIIGNSGR